jgi:hypothetical protein
MPGLKFRILLDTKKNEEIFHDILIADGEDFETFFQTIIKSFEFKGDQMASFYVSNETWDKGEEISLLDLSEGEESQVQIMKDTKVKDHLLDRDQKFILVYDFLKMWIFLIELIGVQEETPDAPQLVLSVGTNPKEDSKELSDDFQMISESMDDMEEDDFGFNDFEDGFSDDDLNSLN